MSLYNDEEQARLDIAKNHIEELYLSLITAYLKNISMETPNRMARAQEMVCMDKAYQVALKKYSDMYAHAIPKGFITLETQNKKGLHIK